MIDPALKTLFQRIITDSCCLEVYLDSKCSFSIECARYYDIWFKLF